MLKIRPLFIYFSKVLPSYVSNSNKIYGSNYFADHIESAKFIKCLIKQYEIKAVRIYVAVSTTSFW